MIQFTPRRAVMPEKESIQVCSPGNPSSDLEGEQDAGGALFTRAFSYVERVKYQYPEFPIRSGIVNVHSFVDTAR